MKALVTGGTGFIGSHLVRLLLRQRCDVAVYARPGPKADHLAEEGVRIFRGDLAKTESLKRAVREADTIFHVGEIPWLGTSRASINIAACQAIIDACAGRKDVRRIVFVSSLTTAGIPVQQPASEETPSALFFQSWYDNYKRQCEVMLLRAHRERGMPTCVLRFGWVYGEGGRWISNLARLIRRMKNSVLPVFGSEKGVMSFVHVDDAARALYQAAARPEAVGETFHILDDEPISFPAFASLLAQRLGYHPGVVNILPLFAPFAPATDLLCALTGTPVRFHPYLQWWNKGVRFANAKMKSVLKVSLAHPTVREGLKTFQR